MTLLTIALVMAVSGGASAAVLVGSKGVKDGSLLNRDLANQAVVSPDVRNDSLTVADFSTLPKGEKGPQGKQGDRGPTGQANYSALERPYTANPGYHETTYECAPAGRLAVHGGMNSSDPRVQLQQSAPTDDRSGWVLGIKNEAPVSIETNVQVFCVAER